jgi:hypothetical protein
MKKVEEQTFNLDNFELTNKLIQVHQEGNYLIGLTEKGVKFRQHIPPNKILNKRGGKFVLDDVVVG